MGGTVPCALLWMPRLYTHEMFSSLLFTHSDLPIQMWQDTLAESCFGRSAPLVSPKSSSYVTRRNRSISPKNNRP
jgi:hypothetical protein